MSLSKWKRLSSVVKFKNKWWTYIIDEYKLPNNEYGEYHYVHTAGSAFIIPFTNDDKIIMVNQYRYLNDRFSLEFPGGGIKENEIPEEIAKKELIEETGFDGDLQYLGLFNPYNGVTNEICYVYTATNLHKCDIFKKDISEEFEIQFLSLPDIKRKIKDNTIYDGMTLASFSLLIEKL